MLTFDSFLLFVVLLFFLSYPPWRSTLCAAVIPAAQLALCSSMSSPKANWSWMRRQTSSPFPSVPTQIGSTWLVFHYNWVLPNVHGVIIGWKSCDVICLWHERHNKGGDGVPAARCTGSVMTVLGLFVAFSHLCGFTNGSFYFSWRKLQMEWKTFVWCLNLFIFRSRWFLPHNALHSQSNQDTGCSLFLLLSEL